jgi:uncharacterized protein (TIGR02757 family)
MIAQQQKQLHQLLLQKVKQYNTKHFIAHDPITIPHLFSKKQDIEIAGFFAATLAWGNRKSIINSCSKLLNLMGNAPHQFIVEHTEQDLKPFLGFVHRTFNTTDLLYFISFLQAHYKKHSSLQSAFTLNHTNTNDNVEGALIGFHNYFFSLPEYPERTKKHVATPERKSACKRLNMFLRWMVRKDDAGVDFGIWDEIKMSQLVCPLDVHVSNVAFKLGIIEHKKSDWKTALALTAYLKTLHPHDPAVFDFALFSLGIAEKI